MDEKAEARAGVDMKAEKEAEEEAAAAESVADGRMSLRPLELWRGLWRLARSSRFLRLLCVGDGLVVGGLVGLFSVLNSFVMSYYGWRQGDLEAVLLATLAPLCTLLFVASARLRLIDRLGAAATECARRPPPAARRPPPTNLTGRLHQACEPPQSAFLGQAHERDL